MGVTCPGRQTSATIEKPPSAPEWSTSLVGLGIPIRCSAVRMLGEGRCHSSSEATSRPYPPSWRACRPHADRGRERGQSARGAGAWTELARAQACLIDTLADHYWSPRLRRPLVRQNSPPSAPRSRSVSAGPAEDVDACAQRQRIEAEEQHERRNGQWIALTGQPIGGRRAEGRARDRHEAATAGDLSSPRQTRHVSSESVGSLSATATIPSGSPPATVCGAMAAAGISARTPRSHPVWKDSLRTSRLEAGAAVDRHERVVQPRCDLAREHDELLVGERRERDRLLTASG